MHLQPGHYILDTDGKTPIYVEELLRWAWWFEKADRVVARDMVGNTQVSTVFLGLDHAFGGGPPLLWETMVFGGLLDQEMERYSSYQEALRGHGEMLARVQSLPQEPRV